MYDIKGLDCWDKKSIRCSKGCLGPKIGKGDGVNKCEYALAKNSELCKFGSVWRSLVK